MPTRSTQAAPTLASIPAAIGTAAVVAISEANAFLELAVTSVI